MRTKLQKSLFRKILYSKYSNIESIHSGELLSLIQDNVDNAVGLVGWNIVVLFQAVISGIGSIVITFVLCWQIGIFTLLAGFALFMVNFIFNRSIKLDSKYIMNAAKEKAKYLTDYFDNYVLLKVFGFIKSLSDMLIELNINKTATEKSMRKKTNIAKLMESIITNLLFFSGLLVMGSIFFVGKTISFGTLMLILQMGNGVIFMFGSIGDYLNTIQLSLVSIEKMQNAVNSYTPDNQNGSESCHNICASNKITINIKNIDFCYQKSKIKILDNFSMSADSLENCFIIGRNGTGKSTIFKLIMKLYEVDKGEILINGININDISKEEIANLISIVMQNPYIFDGTIKENILLGWSANNEELKRCAEIAEISDFIESLPNKYNCHINENSLSYGQKQRISIARAIIRKPRIILLDEFSSGIGYKASIQIMNNIKNELNNTAMIIITHDNQIINSDSKIIELL